MTTSRSEGVCVLQCSNPNDFIRQNTAESPRLALRSRPLRVQHTRGLQPPHHTRKSLTKPPAKQHAYEDQLMKPIPPCRSEPGGARAK